MAEATRKTEGVVRIQGVHHMGIPCNDLDRATDFYTRVLGMEVIMTIRGEARGHFFGGPLPQELREELRIDDPHSEAEYREFLEFEERVRPGRKPVTQFVRLQAGDVEVVIFQRPDPVETETLVENGIYHQSFHISKDDMDRLIELKRQGNSGIRFSNGPALRWPEGRAMYIWDTEGNYLELETNDETKEELKARYMVPR